MDSILGLIVIVFVFAIGAIEKSNKRKKSDAIIKAERPIPAKGNQLRRQASAAVKTFSAETLKALAEEEADAAKASSDGKQLSLIEAFMKENGLDGQSHGSMSMGESVTDENGCIGGSIGEHAEEGESRAEHAEHIAKRNAALTAEHSIAQDAAALRHANRQELRRAIVMAEILDKPVALRRR